MDEKRNSTPNAAADTDPYAMVPDLDFLLEMVWRETKLPNLPVNLDKED